MSSHPHSPATLSIQRALHAARASQRQAATVRGILWALAASPLVFVLAVILSHRFGVGWLWGLLALASLVAIAAYPPLRRMRQLRDDQTLARTIEAACPDLRSDLRAVLSVHAAPAANADAAALRAHLTDRVAGRVGAITDWSVIAPAAKPRRAAAIAAVLLVSALVLATVSPAFQSSMQATTERIQGLERPVPQYLVLGSVRITVTPPRYTKLPPQSFSGLINELTVPKGSTLTFTATSFDPIDAAYLLRGPQDDRQREPIPITQDGTLSFTIIVEDAELLRFAFDTPNGPLEDVRSVQLRLQDDQAPVVTLYDPTGDLEVTPGQVVELQYDVRDDFGVRDVYLVWHFAGREQDADRLILLGDDIGRFAEDRAPFDTAPLYMQPGDEVVVYIEATDYAYGVPNVGVSPALTFFVQEEHAPAEALLTYKEQLFEALLSRLGDTLSQPLVRPATNAKGQLSYTPIVDAASDVQHAAVRNYRQSLPPWDEVFEALDAYLTIAEAYEDTDVSELTLMRSLRRSLFARVERARALVDALGGSSDAVLATVSAASDAPSAVLAEGAVAPSLPPILSRNINTLGAFYADHIHDIERGALVLEGLISKHKAGDVARSLEELSDIRERLRSLLEEYKKSRDPDVRARIERELDRLSRRMNELVEKLAAQVENLPQEHFNADAMERSDASENVETIGQSMQSVRAMLEQGDIDGAMAALDELSQSLDALNQEFGAPGGDSDTVSEFDQAMGEVLDELAEAEAMQQAVEKDTNELEQRLRDAQMEAMRARFERQLTEAKALVDAARARNAAAKNPADDTQLDTGLGEADTALGELRRRLDAKDISEAEDAALDAMDALRRVAEGADRARRFSSETDDKTALQETKTLADKDAQRMRALAEELSELQQALQPTPSGEDAEQMANFGERQQRVNEQLQRLESKMGELAERFPMMESGDDPSMAQASKAGKDAAQRLRQGQGRPALQSQGDALQAMRAMREGMQQRMAQSRAQQQAQQSGRGGAKRDKVDVRQEGERDLRRRQQIQDAMREGQLDAWENPIRQYYESLVR